MPPLPSQGWQPGQLVAVEGPGGRRLGQLLAREAPSSSWAVAGLASETASIEESRLQAVVLADEGIDVVLGPASDPAAAGQNLARALARGGAACCRCLLAPSDLECMADTADRLAKAGAFSRLPRAIEQGYLGRGAAAKTLALDLESSDIAALVQDSALCLAEEALSSLGEVLRPLAREALGFELGTRTSTLLALPLQGAEEDDYESPELSNAEAAGFLMLLRRTTLVAAFNAGPASAILTLTRKVASGSNDDDGEAADEGAAGGGGGGGEGGCEGVAERAVSVPPGVAVMFAVQRCKWSFEPQGKALTCTALFLAPAQHFAISGVFGSTLDLVGGSAGAAQPKPREQPAVVALGTRYAFGADEPWKLFFGYAKANFDVQTRHPYSRWDVAMYYQQDADPMMGKSYTCHGGFFEGVDLFDCKFFDISPMEARGMDPTQRHVLEVSFIALKSAGYTKQGLISKPTNIAAFVGLDKNEWRDIPKGECGAMGASNSANAITANRFNYCLNLRGASMTIDTACSSSLVAQHTAKLYLQYKHYDPCECAIVCGINLSISPLSYIGCCAAGMHSHLGRCFTYNATADGYARGESVGATATKLRPWDPEAGNFAMLAGSHVNQDGRSASLTAPSGPAQERCGRAVLKELAVQPAEIDTTECHGTGTALGDPIELGAYRKVMSTAPREEPVVITTSKSNIGHCEGSAGIGGFIKTVLLCMYGEGTPNCHFNTLNSHLDMDGFPGIITSEGVVFRGDASYNGVLSFGFGGTNACATVWGPNFMTSRALASKDVYDAAYRRLRSLPQQTVAMPSLDWEDWEVDFPPRFPRPDDVWDVELDDEGGALFSRRSRTLAELSADLAIIGSFNDWARLPLEAEPDELGLFVAFVTLGPSGIEDFQVCTGGGDSTTAAGTALTWVPSHPYPCEEPSACVLRVAGAASRDSTWRIAGEEGETYLVEFRLSEPSTDLDSDDGSDRGDGGGGLVANVSWLRAEAGE